MTPPFDLDAHLARLGLDGRAADLRDRIARGGQEALAAVDEVVAAHANRIVFENLDVLARRRVAIDLDRVAGKLDGHRRGGYCHEHAALLRGAWRALGLATRPVLARVHLRPDLQAAGGLTHQASLVLLDGDWWLTDPGFGAGTPPLAVPLDGTMRHDLHGDFRVVGAEALPDHLRADSQFVLQSRRDEGAEFHDVYAFSLREVAASDLDMSNWFTSTRPGTRFWDQVVVSRTGHHGCKATLTGGRLRQVDYATGERSERHLASRDDLVTTLADVFGLEADAAVVDAAWRTIAHRDDDAA